MDNSNPIEQRRINRTRIYHFFVQNPCHSNKDAAEELGLSEVTVGKHARAIRDGWRPEGEGRCDA